MHILSIDTSTKNLSIALCQDEKIIRAVNIPAVNLLEKSIIPSIDRVLKFGKIALEQIQAFGVGLGPGSFTSLRVGLATIKAFAQYGGQKVVGVCSLDVIAQGVAGSFCDEIAVVVDARRKNVYTRLYTPQGKPKGEPVLGPLDDLLARVKGKTLFIGDGLGLYQDKIRAIYKQYHLSGDKSCVAVFAHEHLWLPQAGLLSVIACQRIAQGQTDDPVSLKPLYLYPDDCQTTA